MRIAAGPRAINFRICCAIAAAATRVVAVSQRYRVCDYARSSSSASHVNTARDVHGLALDVRWILFARQNACSGQANRPMWRNSTWATRSLSCQWLSAPSTNEPWTFPVVRALTLFLILHADHEQNCSTSTVRMVGSSGANLFASCAAGVCALGGAASRWSERGRGRATRPHPSLWAEG